MNQLLVELATMVAATGLCCAIILFPFALFAALTWLMDRCT